MILTQPGQLMVAYWGQGFVDGYEAGAIGIASQLCNAVQAQVFLARVQGLTQAIVWTWGQSPSLQPCSFSELALDVANFNIPASWYVPSGVPVNCWTLQGSITCMAASSTPILFGQGYGSMEVAPVIDRASYPTIEDRQLLNLSAPGVGGPNLYPLLVINPGQQPGLNFIYNQPPA
jgi:hypothetical protein